MPWAAPKLPCPPGKWGDSPRAGSWRTHQPGSPRPSAASGRVRATRYCKIRLQGGALGLGAQEVGADAGEAVEEVVLGEARHVSPADAGERGVHAAVGEAGDVLVQGRARRGIQVPVRRRDGGEDEADGRGAEEQARLVSAALMWPEAAVGDPPVGGTPGAAVTCWRSRCAAG